VPSTRTVTVTVCEPAASGTRPAESTGSGQRPMERAQLRRTSLETFQPLFGRGSPLTLRSSRWPSMGLFRALVMALGIATFQSGFIDSDGASPQDEHVALLPVGHDLREVHEKASSIA